MKPHALTPRHGARSRVALSLRHRQPSLLFMRDGPPRPRRGPLLAGARRRRRPSPSVRRCRQRGWRAVPARGHNAPSGSSRPLLWLRRRLHRSRAAKRRCIDLGAVDRNPAETQQAALPRQQQDGLDRSCMDAPGHRDRVVVRVQVRGMADLTRPAGLMNSAAADGPERSHSSRAPAAGAHPCQISEVAAKPPIDQSPIDICKAPAIKVRNAAVWLVPRLNAGSGP